MFFRPRIRRFLMAQNPIRIVWIAGCVSLLLFSGLMAFSAWNHYHLAHQDAERKSELLSRLYNLSVQTRLDATISRLRIAHGLPVGDDLSAVSTDREAIRISGPREDGDGDGHFLILTLPTDTGELHARLSIPELFDMPSHPPLDLPGSLGIMTRDGVLYARFPGGGQFVGTRADLPFAIPPNTPIVRYPVASGLDGVERLVTMHRVAPFDIYTYVALTTPSIRAIWWQQQRPILAVGILGLLLLFGGFFTISALIRFLQHENRALESLAGTDSLTGLPNRRAILNAMTRELARHERMETALSIVILDIDHFKRVNDGFGHAEGDRVLRQSAELLASRLRRSDSCGRIGGEEFILLLPDTPLDGARHLADTIRIAFESEIHAGTTDNGWPVTASFGVCESRPEDTPDRILRRADAVLYTAKETGRNRVICSPQASVSPERAAG